jgi:PAS domain-containing protein
MQKGGYFARILAALRNAKNYVFCSFVSDEYIRSTPVCRKEVASLEGELKYEKSATRSLEAICSKQRKEIMEKEGRLSDIFKENQELSESITSLESDTEYLNSELQEIAGKTYQILDNYRKMVSQYDLRSQIEIPELDELFSKPNASLTALDILEKLHTQKNSLIIMAKKANASQARQIEQLKNEFDEYRAKTIKQIDAMESREKLIAILENVNDSFFILNNQFEVEYISKATKGILGCDDKSLAFYSCRPFERWFSEKSQYEQFSALEKDARNEMVDYFGPLTFTLNPYSKASFKRVVDACFVRISNNKGYLVLLDKAAFFERMKSMAKGILSTAEKAESNPGLAPQTST